MAYVFCAVDCRRFIILRSTASIPGTDPEIFLACDPAAACVAGDVLLARALFVQAAACSCLTIHSNQSRFPARFKSVVGFYSTLIV